jgi:hypothetical protein
MILVLCDPLEEETAIDVTSENVQHEIKIRQTKKL